jgi:WhiB family redox-sensing transcriptional regulator
MAPFTPGVLPGCRSSVGRDDRSREAFVSNHELEWRMLGACRGLDASVFYPENDEDAEIAKQVCRECGVRTACLEFALESREKVGVWGGATERERRRMLRQRRRTA